MAKFTLIAEHIDENGEVYAKVTHEFTEEYLYDVIPHIQEFLRGTGYYFQGDLGIGEVDPVLYRAVQPEENTGCCGGCDTSNHSQHYYDTDRNR